MGILILCKQKSVRRLGKLGWSRLWGRRWLGLRLVRLRDDKFFYCFVILVYFIPLFMLSYHYDILILSNIDYFNILFIYVISANSRIGIIKMFKNLLFLHCLIIVRQTIHNTLFQVLHTFLDNPHTYSSYP